MNWGVGSTKYQSEATDHIITILQNHKTRSFSAVSTDVLEHVPIRLTQIKILLKDMKNQGLVSFDLPPRKRVPEPDTQISIVQRTDQLLKPT